MLQNASFFLRLQTRRQYAKVAVQAKTREREQTPLINCRRKEFNLFQRKKEDSKFGTVQLCSRGWLHNESKGDHFSFNPTVTQEQLQAELQSLQDFLSTGKIQFHPQLLENLQNELKIAQLTGIQVETMPIVYGSFHTLIAAETGCGKTLSYLLPVLN